MKEAGLTHGGFYNHFASKGDLVVEVYGVSFAASLGSLARTVEEGPDQGGSPLERVVARYLSATHRDDPDGGCPSVSLAAHAGQHGEGVAERVRRRGRWLSHRLRRRVRARGRGAGSRTRPGRGPPKSHAPAQ
ncbi:TetR/AcrR family transcriptional regulator [Streptomyces sp. NPDC057621]|uniref:TetR/AcrR family transcriptional regulator n=1 Tax=Streptomyces sp. NPDC057621 TaxID=3346186 RepID=UPI0036ABB9BC